MNQEGYEQARLLLAVRRPDQAMELLYRLLATDPDDAECHYLLTFCHFQTGSYKQATITARKACSLSPNSAPYRIALADALRVHGNRDDAWKEATAAIALDPSYANAFHLRACTENDRGNKNAALADLDQALKLDPTHARALALRSAIRAELHDHAGADADVRAALRIDPTRSSFLARKAWNDFVAGVNTDHEAAFRSALRQDPRDGLARAGLLRALTPFSRWYAWAVRRQNERAALRPVWIAIWTIAAVLYLACSVAERAPWVLVALGMLWVIGWWVADLLGPRVLLTVALLKPEGRRLSTAAERLSSLQYVLVRVLVALFFTVVPTMASAPGTALTLILLLLADMGKDRKARPSLWPARPLFLGLCLVCMVAFALSPGAGNSVLLSAVLSLAPWVIHATSKR